MDCAAEEQLIRLKLGDIPGIQQLNFDLPNRLLAVLHTSPPEPLEQAIHSLNLGASRLSTVDADASPVQAAVRETSILRAVLAINAAFFLIEMTTGLFSHSMGLVADSLDMLADALVYGISLFAVAGTVSRKKAVARLAGYFQLVLAMAGFAEVLRRFFGAEAMPDFTTMIVVSVFALLANSICLWLLQKAQSQEAHMQASMIFSSNDVIINLGVIAAGILVHWLDSNKPDLLVGTVVFVLVMRGAIRILKLGR